MRVRRWTRLWLLCAAFLLAATAAAAQAPAEAPTRESDAAGRFVVRGGIGLSASPTTFLLDLGGLYSLDANWSIGPRLQFGVSDDEKLVAGTLNAEYGFDLTGQSDAYVRRLRPFLQAGTGFTWIQKEVRAGFFGTRKVDGTGFLISVGGGVDYRLNSKVSVGTNVQLNVLPEDARGDHFYFTWNMASMRYRF